MRGIQRNGTGKRKRNLLFFLPEKTSGFRKWEKNMLRNIITIILIIIVITVISFFISYYKCIKYRCIGETKRMQVKYQRQLTNFWKIWNYYIYIQYYLLPVPPSIPFILKLLEYFWDSRMRPFVEKSCHSLTLPNELTTWRKLDQALRHWIYNCNYVCLDDWWEGFSHLTPKKERRPRSGKLTLTLGCN